MNLIRYSFCKLIILDESLNNLDYSNVRAFSNTLTKFHELKPDIGVLMVTHCRSISIISKVVEIDKSSKHLIDGGSYHCNACFGMVSKEGYYE